MKKSPKFQSPKSISEKELSRWEQLRTKYEPLRQDLRHYLEETKRGYCIRHPFCNEPILDLEYCATIHEQIDRRSAQADACFVAGDYEGYLKCIDVTFQPEYLAKDAWVYTDAQYWTLLGMAYGSQKFTIQNRDLFDELFRAERPGREHLMTDQERAILARLPKRVRVYRGYSGDDLYADGIAWTLDREQAIWYANWHRSDDDPMIASGTVSRDDIWAYQEGGDILLPPETVKKRRDVEAYEKAARVPWSEYVPKFDVDKYVRNPR